jgi:hypothetical protein
MTDKKLYTPRQRFEIALRSAKFTRGEFPIPIGLPTEIYPQIMAIFDLNVPERVLAEAREGSLPQRYDLHYGEACDQTDENGCSAEMEESATGEWVKFSDVVAEGSLPPEMSRCPHCNSPARRIEWCEGYRSPHVCPTDHISHQRPDLFCNLCGGLLVEVDGSDDTVCANARAHGEGSLRPPLQADTLFGIFCNGQPETIPSQPGLWWGGWQRLADWLNQGSLRTPESRESLRKRFEDTAASPSAEPKD